jgi:HNH endonuclease
MGRPLEERFWPKVDKTPNGCWLWTAGLDTAGYGKIYVSRGKITSAHRISYELSIGTIQSGMDLDHLCRVPRCVNPDHLQPVTRRENVLRGQQPNVLQRRERLQRNSCKNGHGLEHHIDGHGCKLCGSKGLAEWRTRNRESYNAQNRAYYAANRERILALRRDRKAGPSSASSLSSIV